MPFTNFGREILLRDGSELRLRELRSDDRERLQTFFARCSPDSVRYRFLSSIAAFSDALLDHLTATDGFRHVALVVTQGEDEEVVAEGRYVALKERPQVADVALLVLDQMQRRGLATLLLNELAVIARRNGVTYFRA